MALLEIRRLKKNGFKSQTSLEYFARDKTPTPLGTPYEPRHRPTVGSQKSAFFYERGTPVNSTEPQTMNPKA